MTLEIFVADKLKLPFDELNHLKDICQKFVNRWQQGHCRYGSPKRSKCYMDRLELEFKVYKQHGNAEQLYNIITYAALEAYCPQHEDFHFNPKVNSVTRGKFDGG